MNKVLFFFLLLFPLYSYSQIKLDKAGDGWDLKVDSAINIIKCYDSVKYELLLNVCDKIEFWNNSFSSNNGENIILVSSSDVKLNSLNNLAVVLVHESLHLYLQDRGVDILSNVEENYCYRYELEFLNMLPNPEPWLIQHALEKIKETQ
jgi:hypothetical protein